MVTNINFTAFFSNDQGVDAALGQIDEGLTHEKPAGAPNRVFVSARKIATVIKSDTAKTLPLAYIRAGSSMYADTAKSLRGFSGTKYTSVSPAAFFTDTLTLL